MPYIPSPVWGVWVSDEQARTYFQSNINGRIAILQIAGLHAYIDHAVEQWVKETYGYMGAVLDIPEIRSILIQAGKEGWTPERIQGAITNTAFWRTHSAAERNWLQLSTSDPAEAQRQLNAAKEALRALAQREGVSISAARLDEIALKVASGAITDQATIQRMVVAEAQWSPTAAVGGIAAQASQIKARAREYGIRLTDQGAFDWAKRIESQTADAATVDEFLRQQAKARFANTPIIAQALEQGLTVRQAMDPQIAQVAELLELDPDTIDLSDPRWSALVEYVDPSSNTLRPMTTAEAAQFARQQSEYRATAGAQQAAASFGETLLKTFGAAA